MSGRSHSGLLVYLDRSYYLWHQRPEFAWLHSLRSFEAVVPSNSFGFDLAPSECPVRPSGPSSEAVSFKMSPGAHA